MSQEPEHEYSEDTIPITEPGETTLAGDAREQQHDGVNTGQLGHPH
jgi:hypothetical protein